MSILLLFVLSTLPHSHADPTPQPSPSCASAFYTTKGEVMKRVELYDQFLGSGKSGPEQIKALNEFRAKHGLPITVSIDGKIQGVQDYLEGDDSPGGPNAVVFLKKLKLPRNWGMGLDRVLEVSGPTSKKALRTWSLPYNWSIPRAVRGDEVTFPMSFVPLCAGSAKAELTIAVRPDGSYRVIESKATGFEEVKPMPSEASCPAKALIEGDYTACGQTAGSKPRTFVFAMPMT